MHHILFKILRLGHSLAYYVLVMLLVSGQERRIIVGVLVLFISDGGQLVAKGWESTSLRLHINSVAINLSGILLSTEFLET